MADISVVEVKASERLQRAIRVDLPFEPCPGVSTWSDTGHGRWPGYDDDVGGRRLVIVRGDWYVTAVVDERWADCGIADAKLAWQEDRFDEVARAGPG